MFAKGCKAPGRVSRGPFRVPWYGAPRHLAIAKRFSQEYPTIPRIERVFVRACSAMVLRMPVSIPPLTGQP